MTDKAAIPDALVVVQCRFDSRRLPGKALLPLAGMPMLSFLLRRLGQATGRQNPMVLATTARPVDDIIAAWGEASRVPVIRGETENLLARFARCLQEAPARYAVRVTADNPLTSREMLTACLRHLHTHTPDYLTCAGLPLGTGVDAVHARVLARLCDSVTDPEEQEHINLHILRHPDAFDAVQLPAPGHLRHPALRLTVDTPEDYARVKRFVEAEKAPQPWETPLSAIIARAHGETASNAREARPQ